MAKTLKRDLIRTELNLIAQMHGGMLRAKDGVAYAKKNTKSVLHSCLNWDDGSAAEKWREHQMRNIINAVFVFELVGTEEKQYRGFWSFKDDRKNKGGGYTPVVLSQKQMLKLMLKEALMELQAFDTKYADLTELVEAVSSIRKQYAKKKPVMPITPLVPPRTTPNGPRPTVQ
jgi:hypothetical protein